MTSPLPLSKGEGSKPSHNYQGAFLIIFAFHQSTVVKQQTTTHEKETNPFRQVY